MRRRYAAEHSYWALPAFDSDNATALRDAAGNVTKEITKTDFVEIYPRAGSGSVAVDILWWHDSTNAFGRMLGPEATSMVQSLGGPLVDDFIATVLMVAAGLAMGMGASKTGAPLAGASHRPQRGPSEPSGTARCECARARAAQATKPRARAVCVLLCPCTAVRWPPRCVCVR